MWMRALCLAVNTLKEGFFMSFSEEMKARSQEAWEKNIHHPYIEELVAGTLDKEAFKFYIKQDIYYLKHFGKAHALASAHSDDFKLTVRLAEKAQKTAQAELTVHEQHAKALDLADFKVEDFSPAPAAYNYTSHMYRCCLFGDVGEMIAAILPCYWVYADIGAYYADQHPAEELYDNWIQTYASDWFQSSKNEMIQIMDNLAAEASDAQKEKYFDAFHKAVEFEIAFWSMAYEYEKWYSER